MRRLVLAGISFALLLATPLVTSAKEDPGGLLTQLTALDNAKDQAGLVALFAPDGVIVSPSPNSLDKTETYTGTDQIRAWVKLDVEGDASDDRTELGAISVEGDTASAPFRVFTNDAQLKQAGLEPLLGTVALTAKDGKVARLTISIDPEWMKRAGMAAEAAAGPGTLPTTGETPDPLAPTLAAGLALLGIGLALRRARRAA